MHGIAGMRRQRRAGIALKKPTRPHRERVQDSELAAAEPSHIVVGAGHGSAPGNTELACDGDELVADPARGFGRVGSAGAV